MAISKLKMQRFYDYSNVIFFLKCYNVYNVYFTTKSIQYILVTWVSQHQEPQTKSKDTILTVDSHISN